MFPVIDAFRRCALSPTSAPPHHLQSLIWRGELADNRQILLLTNMFRISRHDAVMSICAASRDGLQNHQAHAERLGAHGNR